MHKTSKATFVLPTPLLEELRHFVQAGMADSLSALVRQSLEMRARRWRGASWNSTPNQALAVFFSLDS